MSDVRTTSSTRKTGTLAAGAAAAAMLIAGYEGLRTHAYLDITRTPTICFGETADVHMGDVRTKPECVNLLREDIQARVPAMQRCLKRPVPPVSAAWMIDYGYNVGAGRFCRQVAPLVNQGQMVAACRALGTPTTSKHIVIRALVTRRKAEVAGCLKGL